MSDIKTLQDEMHQATVALRESLKQREERDQKADAMLTEKLNRINDVLDKAEDKLEKLEKVEALVRARNEVSQASERSPEVKAFLDYVRRGDDMSNESRAILESKAVSGNSTNNAQGGYLVVPEISNQITKVLNETSPIRRVANVVTISTDEFVKPQQTDLPTAAWADRDAAPSQTDVMTWRQLTIRTHEIYAEPRMSKNFVADSVLDIEGYLMQALTESFDITQNTAFVSGDGVGQPIGFLSYTAGTSWGQIEQVVSGSASALTAAGINNLVYALKDGYLPNAVFMMRRDTVRLIRLLVDGNGNALWTPAFGQEPAQIMGYPVIRAADMPAVTSDSLSIAFGDFRRGYQIVDRQGMLLLRDPYTAKPFIKYFVTTRVGGAVDNSEAIKIQKVAAS